jgi:hypothetical protein
MFKFLMISIFSLLMTSITYAGYPTSDTYMCTSNNHLSIPVLMKIFSNNEVIFVDYYKDTYAKMEEATAFNVESEEASELERDYGLRIDTFSQMKISKITDSAHSVVFTLMTSEENGTRGTLRFIKSTNNDLIYKCM